jgi:hypothetical protein
MIRAPMISASHRSRLRICRWAALTSVNILVAGVSLAAEQDAPHGERRASSVLEDFGEAWDTELWLPAEGRLSRYMRPLDDSGWKRRIVALQRIAQSEKNATAELSDALKSESAVVRALAAQALGYRGDAEAKPVLARTVQHDADPMVRLYAADSLGMLGGRDYEELLRRVQTSEKNRDTKRHIGYALDRAGRSVDAGVTSQLRDWKTDELASAKLGLPAPDFQLISIDDQTVRLSDFRGKKSVVLVFIYGDT